MKAVEIIASTLAVIVLLGFVAIPVIGDMQNSANNTGDNDTDGAKLFKLNSSYTSTIEYQTDKFVFSDSALPATGAVVIVTDSLVISANSGRTVLQVAYDTGSATGFLNMNNTSSIAFSGSSWTITLSSSTSYTGSFTWALVQVTNGADYYAPASLPAFVDSDSKVYAYNVTKSAAPYYVVSGTLSSMSIDFQNLAADSTFTALTGVTATSTATDYSNSLTKLVLDQTEGADIDVTEKIIVPIEYQYGPEGDSIVISIVSLVPVILIVALLVAIVGRLFLKSRDEY